MNMNYLNMNKEEVEPVVNKLNILLAEYHMYYQKLRNFHWNIVGKSFFDLHEKFEELYGDARIKIDEIAERILTLGYHPVSQYSDYMKIAIIKESDSLITDREMVKILLTDHSTLLATMKNVISKAGPIGDEGTIDMIGAYIRELEKSSWMLNAWSKKTDETLNTLSISKIA